MEATLEFVEDSASRRETRDETDELANDANASNRRRRRPTKMSRERFVWLSVVLCLSIGGAMVATFCGVDECLAAKRTVRLAFNVLSVLNNASTTFNVTGARDDDRQ